MRISIKCAHRVNVRKQQESMHRQPTELPFIIVFSVQVHLPYSAQASSVMHCKMNDLYVTMQMTTYAFVSAEKQKLRRNEQRQTEQNEAVGEKIYISLVCVLQIKLRPDW